MRLRGTIALWLGAGFLNLAATPPAPDWQKSVTTLPRGDFPNPRPVIATYNFGWSDLVAATAEIRFARVGDQLQLDGTGQTIGIVRALWKFDTHHQAAADAATLQPISMHQVDELRHKTRVTDLIFKPGVVERLRTESKGKKNAAPKTFHFSGGVYDMHSALLYLRSQPLRQGDVYRIVVYPATNAYLVTLAVTSHARLTTRAGTYPAIRLDVQLKKIGKNDQLEPHKKFRRASVWVSDDADRLLLRIEASVFIGTVFAELQSARFPNEKESAAAPEPGHA